MSNVFEFDVQKSCMYVRHRPIVICGREYRAKFNFSEDWDGFTKVATFRAVEIDWELSHLPPIHKDILLWNGDNCVIPWEVLITPKQRLQIGVYGTKGLEYTLPTVWHDCGFTLDGSNIKM